MTDQARNLRAAITGAATPTTAADGAAAVPRLPALAVTGGKGGVGKTSIAVNLSLLLKRLGLKPCLVDFDLGLANADVLLGVAPTATLAEVILGGAPLESAIMTAPGELPFVPAASGREELTRLGQAQLQQLFAALGRIAAGYDLLVIDTAAGIGREVMAALRAAKVVLVVVTPEPTSLADAYALIKVLETSEPGRDIRVVINQANNQSDGMETFNRLRKVANSFLQRDLALAGVLPRDRAVGDAVRARRPFALGADNPMVQALRAVAMRLKGEAWKG
jgi:flagellar biosynthesis protein FlhG